MRPSVTTELGPPEYAAVRHILSSPSVLARCRPHIGAEDFDWAAILTEAETMSRGEQLLVRIASDLWEATSSVAVWELTRLLDRTNFPRVIAALEMCRGELSAGRLDVEVLRNAA
jgi:hypothetical protein